MFFFPALRLLLIPSFQWEIEPQKGRGKSQLQKLKVSSATSPNLLWVQEDFYHFRNIASKTSKSSQSSSSFSKGFYPTLLFLCVEFYRRCSWVRLSERVSPSNFFLPSFPPISSQDDVFRQHSHSWLNRGWDYYYTGCVYTNIVRIAKGCPLSRPLT